MTAFLVTGIRSVDLVVPDVAAAMAFYTDVWGLEPAGQNLLHATGDDHHVLALHHGPRAAIRSVTFRVADRPALDMIANRATAAGGKIISQAGPMPCPAGGTGLVIQDPQGRTLRFVTGDTRRSADPPRPDRPYRLSHVNINSRDTGATRDFFVDALGFRMTDRSKMMAFVRCNSDHHAVVIADAPVDGLNHVAFMMPGWEGVMLGAGRMVDHGHQIAWGVGRHGPGDNVFAYFTDPAGIVIEYTAEVLQVDDTYRVRGPADWTWPPGRTDHWGIAAPKSAALKQAQLAIPFEAQL